MREPIDPLTERMRATTGLGPLLAEAEAVWRSRIGDTGSAPAGSDQSGSDKAGSGQAGSGQSVPAWRPFEDAFPTFYQFTNRPPR